jgi:hypothetical protein
MFGEKICRKCCYFDRLSAHRVRDFTEQELKLTCEEVNEKQGFCVNLTSEVLIKCINFCETTDTGTKVDGYLQLFDYKVEIVPAVVRKQSCSTQNYPVQYF